MSGELGTANKEVVASQVEQDQPGEPITEGEQTPPVDAQPEPEVVTEEQRIQRLERALERNKRDKREARDRAKQLEAQIAQLTKPAIGDNNGGEDDDSEPLSLSKAELRRLIDERANEIAPTIAQKQSMEQRIHSAAVAAKEALGEDDFDEIASELGELLPADKQLKLLEADKPADLMRHLAENPQKARSLSGMTEFQFGVAIAKLQTEIAAKPRTPEVSKAAEPLRPVRQSAPVNDSLPKDSDPPEVWHAKEYARLNKLRGTARA